MSELDAQIPTAFGMLPLLDKCYSLCITCLVHDIWYF